MGKVKTKGYACKYVSADMITYNITFKGNGTSVKNAMKDVITGCENFLTDIIDKTNWKPNAFHLTSETIKQDWNDSKDIIIAEREISFTCKFDGKLHNEIVRIIKDRNINATMRTTFNVSNPEDIHAELLGKAVLNAKAKAEKIVEACGKRIVAMDSVMDDKYREDYDAGPLLGCVGDIVLNNASQISDEISPEEKLFDATVYVKWVTE